MKRKKCPICLEEVDKLIVCDGEKMCEACQEATIEEDEARAYWHSESIRQACDD